MVDRKRQLKSVRKTVRERRKPGRHDDFLLCKDLAWRHRTVDAAVGGGEATFEVGSLRRKCDRLVEDDATQRRLEHRFTHSAIEHQRVVRHWRKPDRHLYMYTKAYRHVFTARVYASGESSIENTSNELNPIYDVSKTGVVRWTMTLTYRWELLLDDWQLGRGIKQRIQVDSVPLNTVLHLDNRYTATENSANLLHILRIVVSGHWTPKYSNVVQYAQIDCTCT